MPYITSVERIGYDRGRQEGRKEGRQEGRKEGRQEGQISGHRSLVLRQLYRRLGMTAASATSADWQGAYDRIHALSLEQLEALGEALLDFSTIADLTHWLDIYAG
jgi:predicted transposase YdaD